MGSDGLVETIGATGGTRRTRRDVTPPPGRLISCPVTSPSNSMDTESRDRLLSSTDRAVVEAGGADAPTGREPREAGSNPLVLVVDVQRHLVGSDVPILEAIEEYRTAAGEIAWQAIDEIQPLLATARRTNTQVAYTRVIPEARSGLGPADVAIADPVAPETGEWVIDRPRSSAFHATDLASRLVRERVDTLVLVGCSTGSCVRATAVDAHQRGFGVVVAAECTFDRIRAAHDQALFDIDGRYGHVASRPAIEAYLRSIGEE